ncbi:hypothetical protein J6590_108306 [Homalodisca vitripennis]|nr:hypothetical protein J6590_108306 [Homalodisca vitripennis]
MCYVGIPVMTRFNFVKALGNDLIRPHLQRRLQIPNLRRELRESILKSLGENNPLQARVEGIPSDRLQKRKTCSKCPSARERKTQYKCIKCSSAICLECSRKVCNDCAKDCV